MLENMKLALSQLGAIAGSYLPVRLKETWLKMAHEIDQLTLDVAELRKQLDEIKEAKDAG